MTIKQKIIVLIVVTILFSSCKKEEKLNFKYPDKEDLFECASTDMELIKEAVYTFEDFIKNKYSHGDPYTVSKGYRNFLNNTAAGFMPVAEKFDTHIKEVIYKLKDEKSLWNITENKTSLNYNNNVVKCILKNIQNQENKTILSSMIASNTIRPKIFAPAINTNTNRLEKDRALATYVALDMFYSKLLHLNLSLSPIELSKQLKEINESNHAGHNH